MHKEAHDAVQHDKIGEWLSLSYFIFVNFFSFLRKTWQNKGWFCKMMSGPKCPVQEKYIFLEKK